MGGPIKLFQFTQKAFKMLGLHLPQPKQTNFVQLDKFLHFNNFDGVFDFSDSLHHLSSKLHSGLCYCILCICHNFIGNHYQFGANVANGKHWLENLMNLPIKVSEMQIFEYFPEEIGVFQCCSIGLECGTLSAVLYREVNEKIERISRMVYFYLTKLSYVEALGLPITIDFNTFGAFYCRFDRWNIFFNLSNDVRSYWARIFSIFFSKRPTITFYNYFLQLLASFRRYVLRWEAAIYLLLFFRTSQMIYAFSMQNAQKKMRKKNENQTFLSHHTIAFGCKRVESDMHNICRKLYLFIVNVVAFSHPCLDSSMNSIWLTNS